MLEMNICNKLLIQDTVVIKMLNQLWTSRDPSTENAIERTKTSREMPVRLRMM